MWRAPPSRTPHRAQLARGEGSPCWMIWESVLTKSKSRSRLGCPRQTRNNFSTSPWENLSSICEEQHSPQRGALWNTRAVPTGQDISAGVTALKCRTSSQGTHFDYRENRQQPHGKTRPTWFLRRPAGCGRAPERGDKDSSHHHRGRPAPGTPSCGSWHRGSGESPTDERGRADTANCGHPIPSRHRVCNPTARRAKHWIRWDVRPHGRSWPHTEPTGPCIRDGSRLEPAGDLRN